MGSVVADVKLLTPVFLVALAGSIAGCASAVPPSAELAFPIAAPARVLVAPAASSVAVGNSISVEARVEGTANLWGVMLKVSYDPSIAECIEPQVGALPLPQIVAKNICGKGIVEYIVTQQAPSVPADGSGAVARWIFRCASVGTTSLRVESLKLVDRDGLVLPAAAESSQIVCVK